MQKLTCEHTWAGGQVLQNESHQSSTPSCCSGGKHSCQVVAAPECSKLQCWLQSCCYRFQLQTALIFAIHYWEWVFSACQVLVSQEVWSQLDSCQGHTCYRASIRLQFLVASQVDRHKWMGRCSSKATQGHPNKFCFHAVCWGPPAGSQQKTRDRRPWRVTGLFELWWESGPTDLFQGSCLVLPVQSLAVPFPLLLLLLAGWNASQLFPFFIHRCSLM